MNRLRRHRPWKGALFRSPQTSENSKTSAKSSANSSTDNSPTSEQWSDAIEDQRDGFYKYSDPLIKDADEMLKMNAQKRYRGSDEGSEVSFHSDIPCHRVEQ